MYTVKTPVKGYTGYGYGLHFSNGEAHTDDNKIIKKLDALGYEIIKEIVDETETLRAEAESLGLKPHWNASADKIRQMIEERKATLGGADNGTTGAVES